MCNHVRTEERSRIRRAVFSYVVTAFCLASMMVLAFFKKDDSQLALRTMESFSSIVEWMISIYLGASVIDRSGVLKGIASRISQNDSKEGAP